MYKLNIFFVKTNRLFYQMNSVSYFLLLARRWTEAGREVMPVIACFLLDAAGPTAREPI